MPFVKFKSKIGLFVRFELIYIVFFIIYGFTYNKWSETKLTFLVYTLISILSGFGIQTFSKFDEIVDYFKF